MTASSTANSSQFSLCDTGGRPYMTTPPKKKFSAEQIVTLFRQIEVSMAQGKSG